jgi:hypothetical protein
MSRTSSGRSLSAARRAASSALSHAAPAAALEVVLTRVQAKLKLPAGAKLEQLAKPLAVQDGERQVTVPDTSHVAAQTLDQAVPTVWVVQAHVVFFGE